MHLGMGMLPTTARPRGIIGDLSVRENIILAMQAKRGIVDLIPMKEQEESRTNSSIFSRSKCASRRNRPSSSSPAATSRRSSSPGGFGDQS